MASWGLVATVKAAEEKVLAYVAHHLSLGADHIWIYFDDAADPAQAALADHPRVSTTLCDAAYWADKNRHERHQNRQARNARDAYQRCTLDWLGHLDVDEFLLADRPLADILADTPPDQRVVKLEPFEAMHDPGLPDDIFTARDFRGALRQDQPDLRAAALGDYGARMRNGMLSHAAGKVLFRTGIRKLMPRLHGVLLNGERLEAPGPCREARVLHFHAQDPAAWEAALPFRLTRGAYQYQPELQDFLSQASPEEVRAFYIRTQTLTPDIARSLQQAGRLIRAELDLRAKVAAFREGAFA